MVKSMVFGGPRVLRVPFSMTFRKFWPILVEISNTKSSFWSKPWGGTQEILENLGFGVKNDSFLGLFAAYKAKMTIFDRFLVKMTIFWSKNRVFGGPRIP